MTAYLLPFKIETTPQELTRKLQLAELAETKTELRANAKVRWFVYRENKRPPSVKELEPQFEEAIRSIETQEFRLRQK